MEEPSGRPAGDGEGEGMDGEGDLADLKKLNEDLLMACMRNDTDAAVKLIEAKADVLCEDSRQWSPLIWAASHGNEELTRLLIKLNAADVYKYDREDMVAAGLGGAAGALVRVKRKKHSPLHWAAFKGHLKVLWLLMAPPQSLSHHEKDAIGNTALHQAAAGGSLECVQCLMAQGVDVFAKNDRGHTPYVLCTMPEVQNLLMKAMNTVACKTTNKQFSSTVHRYLCSWSLEVFSQGAVTQMHVYESPDALEKEKPVTWCTEVKKAIQEAEQELNHAMTLNQLDAICTALASAENKPVDCKLVHQCAQVKAKLESEIQLSKAMTVTTVTTNLDDFGAVHEALSLAIENAELKNAEPSKVLNAKLLRRKLVAEASLMRAVEGQQKTTPGHILMLEELTLAAKGEQANEDLLEKARKLIAKLKSEREVQQRIAETATLCQLGSFKDALALLEKDREKTEEEGDGSAVTATLVLPEWSTGKTENFEQWHDDYKRIVEQAAQDEISDEYMSVALEQLVAIEHLLMEKKQIEQEGTLKDSKKKKGGKKM